MPWVSQEMCKNEIWLFLFFLSTNSQVAFESIEVHIGFWQAKFANGGSILGSSQFTLMHQLPLKTMLSLKVVKIDSKISNSLHQSKSLTHSVAFSLTLTLKKTIQVVVSPPRGPYTKLSNYLYVEVNSRMFGMWSQ